MNLHLNIYTDETLTEIKRVAEADSLKIPYRVSIFILKALDGVEINNNEDLVKFISQNIEKLDTIIKATFGVSNAELECVDTIEVIDALKDLFVWATDKIKRVAGNQKN